MEPPPIEETGNTASPEFPSTKKAVVAVAPGSSSVGHSLSSSYPPAVPRAAHQAGPLSDVGSAAAQVVPTLGP
jgi:hypothetical protein